MSSTATAILILAAIGMVGSIAAAISKLSNSGKEQDTPRATLYAVQACAGFLLAWIIASIGLAALVFVR